MNVLLFSGQDKDDNFFVDVTITPDKTQKGHDVTFTCNFTLINGYVMNWERGHFVQNLRPTTSGNQEKCKCIFPVREKSGDLGFLFLKNQGKLGNFDNVTG